MLGVLGGKRRENSPEQMLPVLPSLGTELQEFETFPFEPGLLSCYEHRFAKRRGYLFSKHYVSLICKF